MHGEFPHGGNNVILYSVVLGPDQKQKSTTLFMFEKRKKERKKKTTDRQTDRQRETDREMNSLATTRERNV